jgi:hypothetical protein
MLDGQKPVAAVNPSRRQLEVVSQQLARSPTRYAERGDGLELRQPRFAIPAPTRPNLHPGAQDLVEAAPTIKFGLVHPAVAGFEGSRLPSEHRAGWKRHRPISPVEPPHAVIEESDHAPPPPRSARAAGASRCGGVMSSSVVSDCRFGGAAAVAHGAASTSGTSTPSMGPSCARLMCTVSLRA